MLRDLRKKNQIKETIIKLRDLGKK